MGVTACQDPHEEPRTTSDGRPRPGPPPVPQEATSDHEFALAAGVGKGGLARSET